MKAQDLKDKCSRAMLESGPDVMVKLTIPRPAGPVAKGVATGLGLTRDGGPAAMVVGEGKVGDQETVDVQVKAAVLLKAVQALEERGA